jgi:MFS family permease
MGMENALIARRRKIFINQNFAMIWIGGTIARLSEALLLAGFGFWILTFIVKGQPAAGAAAIKGIMMIGFVALFLLGPFAGVFVDRWKDKKRVLVLTSFLRVFCALLPIPVALFLSSQAHLSAGMIALALGTIYLATFLISTFTHFAIPASYVLFADCVEEKDYSYANGVLLTTSFLGLMVGVPLGLVLFRVVGFPGVLLFDAFLYVASFFAATRIQLKAQTSEESMPRKGFFTDFKEGIALCGKNSLLRILLLTLVLVNIWNGAISMLGASFIIQNLHTAYAPPLIAAPEGSSDVLGLTMGIAFALGSLLFGLTARHIGGSGGRMSEKRVFSYSLLFIGILSLVLSRFTQYIPALGVIFLISLLTMGVNIVAVPLYLWVTPRRLLGRVRAIVDFTTNLAPIIAGGTVTWLLSSHLRGFHAQVLGLTFTPIDTIFAITGVICAVGGIFVARALTSSSRAGVQAMLATNESNIQAEETKQDPINVQ